jgi:hypothetical protein
LGRSGWLRILIGAGQRIEFPDGDRWRLRSVSIGGSIGLVVLDGCDRKVAMASFSGGAYSITGRDFGCVLVPGDARRRRAHRWMVRHGEDELAAVTKVPLSIHAFEPLPLGVVLLCLVLVRSGVPGESPVKLPKFRW